MAAPGSAATARFGGFEFDLSSHELRKGQTRLKVPDQSLEILAMLLERPGELVTRESIQARLWPNGTVVEFEHSVNSAIKRLRQALLDTANEPRFIETLPRKGYRFIGVIEALPDELVGLTPGTIISHYRIVAEAGRGGMGIVYKAEDSNLGRMVALKFLPDELASHPPALERMRREARMIAALNHPGICTMYELGEAGGRVFLAMEFLEGETLRQRIARQSMTQSEIIDVGRQVTKALEAAHAVGIIHRDIKPDNLFLTKQGVLKLMDFGLAKPARSSSDSTLTDSGLVVGTAAYMSPEQVRGEVVDSRSDIFSFGVVLFEMLSGKQAFTGKSSVEVMNAILNDEPPELPNSVPAILDRIVRHCLEKNPQHRFQSAADLGFALQSSLAGPVTVNARRKPRLNWYVLSAAAILVAAASVFWWSAHQSTPGLITDVTFRRLTNHAGLTTGAAISPDGKLIAYASDRADPSHLNVWVQQVDGGGELRITNDDADAYDPSFSSDGTRIAFRSERHEPGIYTASVLGGDIRMIVPEGRRPRFSPDGKQIMYWTGPSDPFDVRGSSDTKIWVRNIAGGKVTQIGVGCRVFERTPVWSPDSRRLLFIGTCGNDLASRGDQPENYGIKAWVSSLDGKKLVPNLDLSRIWTNIHGWMKIDQWIPGQLLIPLQIGDATSLTAVPISGDGTKLTGAPRRLADASGNSTFASAAVDGRIALSEETTESHIWTVEIDSKGAAGTARQVTFGPAGERTPALSRDGKSLAFLSLRANGERLFHKILSTGQEQEVSTDGYRYDTPVFSPDGTHIFCVQYPRPDSWRNAIFDFPLAGGIPQKVWDKTTFSWLWDQSPDGSTLLLNARNSGDLLFTMYFLTQDPSGLNLKSMQLSNLLPQQDKSVMNGHFSHDGRWVIFDSQPNMNTVAKSTRSETYAVRFSNSSVPPNEWIPITKGHWDANPHFSNDDTLILFISERDGFRCLWAQRVTHAMTTSGEPFAVCHLHEYRRQITSFPNLTVGGNTIAFERSERSGNIWLLEPRK